MFIEKGVFKRVKLKVCLVLALLGLPAHAVAGSSVSAMPGKPLTHDLPDCKKHEKNVDDCHIPNKDTFLHLKKAELPDGWHAKSEYKERERRSKKND